MKIKIAVVETDTAPACDGNVCYEPDGIAAGRVWIDSKLKR